MKLKLVALGAAALAAAGLLAGVAAQDTQGRQDRGGTTKDKEDPSRRPLDKDRPAKLAPSFAGKVDRISTSTRTLFLAPGGGSATQLDREAEAEKDRTQQDRQLKDRGATDRRRDPAPQRVRSVTLANDAKVTLDGKDANLSDLKPGHTVQVWLEAGGNDPLADRVEALSKEPVPDRDEGKGKDKGEK